MEPLLRAIRLGMRDAGMQVESAKGECNLGQHEIAFKYTDALTTCDNHVIYKTGAKEIAAQHGSALTFMAKYDEREGNSCHVHLSLRDDDGEPVFAGDGPGGVSAVFEHFLAGQLAALRELSYFFAPNINSYKRYQPGSFAPTAVLWGFDNRTCALRVVGHGPEPALREPRARRRRQPVPRGRGDDRRRPARRRQRAAARAGVRRQRLRRATPRACRRTLREAAELLADQRDRARAPSATMSSTTTPTPPASSSPRSTRRSPTGNSSAASSGCERTHDRPTTCINPATEQVVTTVDLRRRRADRRRDRAARARHSRPGARSRPGDRARLLRRFADAVDGDREHLAQLEVANSGHTIGNARWEAGNVRDVIAYYSAAPERLIGQQIPVADGIDVTFHEPLGVVGVIVPWNFPMPIASWGFAPALAAGNTVVLKPAELTPLTAMRLAELALEAGLPAGRLPGAARQGQRRRPALRRPPGRRQDRVHRLDRGRPAGDGRLRGARSSR